MFGWMWSILGAIVGTVVGVTGAVIGTWNGSSVKL